MGNDWNNGVVDPEKNIRKYLFYKYKDFKTFGAGYYIGENNQSELMAYLESYNNNNIVLHWIEQSFENKDNFARLYLCDKSNGSNLQLVLKEEFTTSTQNYYKRSIELFDKYPQLNGVFAEPYVIEGNVAMHYSVRIFNQSLYDTKKQFIGIAKIDISLKGIQQFLSQITLQTSGYVLVAEENNLVIGGSINTTTLDNKGRLSLFDITDRNAGQLMKDIYNKYKSFNQLPYTLVISSEGIEYTVSHKTYTLENISWRIFIVTREMNYEMILSSSVSGGVAFVCILFGFIASVLVGTWITSPLLFLEKQFETIRDLSFEKIQFTRSYFKEVNNIYKNLEEMVYWLQEFKTFLPENVVTQLSEINERQTLAPKFDTLSIAESAMSVLEEERTTTALFKLGLHIKYCSIIYVRLSNLLTDFEDLVNLFGKIIAVTGTITKILQADIQILSVDEFQILFSSSHQLTSSKALTAALRISKSIDGLNEAGGSNIIYSIGVSSGQAHIGHIGTQHIRFFGVIGENRIIARKLSYLAGFLQLKILVDEPSLTSEFVARPVDKIKVNKNEEIQTVYELIKENNVEVDEWMYELEEHKLNQKFKYFQEAFDVLTSYEVLDENELLSRLEKSYSILKDHLHTVPEDRLVTTRLMDFISSLIERMEEGESFESIRKRLAEHHSDLSISWKTFTNFLDTEMVVQELK
ncbi:hypothetical protein ABK040_012161 [Willaertia magna]